MLLKLTVKNKYSVLFQGLRLGKKMVISPLMQKYIMRNAGLEEAQAGIKTAEKNINNLRYADDTILMAENK